MFKGTRKKPILLFGIVASVLVLCVIVFICYSWYASGLVFDEAISGPSSEELSRAEQDTLSGYLRGNLLYRAPWTQLDKPQRLRLVESSFRRVASDQENVYRVLVLEHERGNLAWPEFPKQIVEYVNACEPGSGYVLQFGFPHIGVPSPVDLDLERIVRECREPRLWGAMLSVYKHERLAEAHKAFTVFAEAESTKEVQQALSEILGEDNSNIKP